MSDEVLGKAAIVLSVSDQAQLGSLAQWVGAEPGVLVERTAGIPGEGEQGVADVLTMLAGSSGLIAAIKVLPEFLRARRADLSVTMVVNGQPFTLTAKNIDEVMPLVEGLLDARD